MEVIHEKLRYNEGFEGPVEHRFNPYSDNGGTVATITGDGFAVIASDTRLSNGFSIFTRNQSKLYPLTEKAVLGVTGCWCDVLSMTKLIEGRMKLYKQAHHKDMTIGAIAQMLTTILYNRRFFPYYVSNILAGINEKGKGVVYSYDPVGHCDESTYHAGGSSGALLQPLLDSQIGLKNMAIKPTEPITLERAKQVVMDVFTSAAERDIHCGDGVVMKIITAQGIEEITQPLRID